MRKAALALIMILLIGMASKAEPLLKAEKCEYNYTSTAIVLAAGYSAVIKPTVIFKTPEAL
ncbi:MAG: hypothetical protein IPG60_06245 [Bacteroidetes bacterium]|nr:hypothetical protein [Bacteroidota bacterium]MBP8752832.1 hypothetical protein [Chitinophagales bacterium]MBK7110332.1 hypothetical protein [Bacteroidota bacterium]MBK8488383.1 hypothetical protein [Bacteroidota bacterium]MBK8681853.1 hypothetical protein [Bacteroidota bacterium]